MHVHEYGTADCTVCKNYQPEAQLVNTERFWLTPTGHRVRVLVCANCINTMHDLITDKEIDEPDDQPVVADVRRSARRAQATAS